MSQHEQRLVGRWRVEQGLFAGLEYDFREDGSFVMEMSEFRVHGAGRYHVRADGPPFEIDIHFVKHSAPEGLGVVRGIFDVQDDLLKMKVGSLSDERWMDPGAFITYARAA